MERPSVFRRFRGHVRGTSAVEFALVTPFLLTMVFGIVVFGTVLNIYHGVQQLAAEAARAAVAGLSDAESDRIARDFVLDNVGAYAFIDPVRLTVVTHAAPAPALTFEVSLSYDLSPMFIFGLSRLLPMPVPTVHRSAIVQRGGF